MVALTIDISSRKHAAGQRHSDICSAEKRRGQAGRLAHRRCAVLRDVLVGINALLKNSVSARAQWQRKLSIGRCLTNEFAQDRL
jgi:hypothetical protein